MSDKLRILGIAGSLRRESYNRWALRAAVELVPEGAEIEIFELDGIPGFNQDEEQNPPAKVAELKQKVRAADAILFVTPEYNYSVPGVLKNAIDWASRPPAPPFGKKPVATLGASPGMHGTVRGQTQLRELCIGLGMYVVPKPEVYVAKANEKFDAEGNLTDEATKKFVAELLVNLAGFTRTLRGR